MNPGRLVIAGGSGFLGNVLANHFAARRMEVVILTRNPTKPGGSIRHVHWDGTTVGDWLKELEGAWALIILAGVSVNCRYHARNRKLLLDSRLRHPPLRRVRAPLRPPAAPALAARPPGAQGRAEAAQGARRHVWQREDVQVLRGRSRRRRRRRWRRGRGWRDVPLRLVHALARLVKKFSLLSLLRERVFYPLSRRRQLSSSDRFFGFSFCFPSLYPFFSSFFSCSFIRKISFYVFALFFSDLREGERERRGRE